MQQERSKLSAQNNRNFMALNERKFISKLSTPLFMREVVKKGGTCHKKEKVHQEVSVTNLLIGNNRSSWTISTRFSIEEKLLKISPSARGERRTNPLHASIKVGLPFERIHSRPSRKRSKLLRNLTEMKIW